MPQDNKSSKLNKKFNKLDKKREELNKKKKRNESSDSSDNDDETVYSTEEEEMDVHEYRKFLKKIFPSKHLDKKIKDGDKLKKKYEEILDDESSDTEENIKVKSKNKKNKKSIKNVSSDDESYNSDDESNHKKTIKKNKKKKNKKDDSDNDDISLGSEDSDSDYNTEDCDDSYSDESDSESNSENNSKKDNQINMVFTIGFDGDGEDDEEWVDEDEWEDESEATENEDDPVSESDTSDNDDSDNESESEESDKKETKKSKKDKDNNKKSKKDKDNKKGKKEKENKISKKNKKEKAMEELNAIVKSDTPQNDEEVLKQLKEIYEKDKNNETIKECIKICEQKIKKNSAKKERHEKKVKAKHGRIFRKIMKDKNTMNDFYYFNTLEMEHQKKLIKELREINKTMRIEKPYRITLLESEIPTIFKGTAIKKINSLKYMDQGTGEYYKIKNWVDTFMRIPFGKYETLPINITDGVELCHDFMETAQKTLDDAVYGLNDAKMQIMQMLGQLITNPKAIGSAIAIQGPMGTGKTTLVKEGISKILKRPFAFLALGGATDSSFLEGHSYTYEGSTWGKIVQILIDSKCMNPVIYFDELDKISDTPKGEEIAGILTHLTDTSQNSQFHDKYFAEVDFDLSKCLFIFSYNDESKVNPILRDRMYRIQTKGYDKKQKTIISNNYLLPKLREQVKFNDDQIIIPEESLHHIIENHCNKEDGVRNLKRCLEIIHTKLNLYRLMRPDTNLFEQDMSIKVEFPFTVTKIIVDKLIKKEECNVRRSLEAMYV